ncbi:extracellular solute-binding protein [Ochrobactrum sp. C6C9]|uniref:ABC transporter substrate-binding protein n=1 Tax=Ochrobactrum sp. C6C9 TaxID=2736662 RepID=UPI00352FF060|nr:extracellular solute-binding protein [Ochrobactrum sp. C6C9]
MLKKVLVCGSLAFLAFGSAPVRAQEAATLNLTTWQAEEPGFKDWWAEVIAAYEKANPDVDINVQKIPYKEYANQLTVRMASGQPPEILTLSTDGFGTFAEQGWLSPLDEKIKGTAIADNWSSLQSELVWQGQTEGVLLMGYGFMLFYNEDLLQKAGITPPTSFEEFMQAVPKATDRDAGIFGLAAVTMEHPTLTLDFIRFIEWQGQKLIKDGHYNLTDPGVIAAVEKYRQTVGGNAALGNNSTMARQLFTEGKAAFLIDGPWMYSSVEKAPPEVRQHLKMIKAPFTPVLGGASNSIHIPMGLEPDVQDKAWSFIEFLSQPEWQQRYTQLTSAPAARQNILTPELEAKAPQLKTINDGVVGAEPIIPNVKEIRANSGEFYAITQRAALQVLSTQEPVADILAGTQETLERTIPLGN